MEVFEGFDESTLDFHLGWSDDESVYTTEKRKGGGRLVSILSRVKRRFEQRILVLTNAQPLLIATLSSCDSRVCNNQTNLDNSYRTVSTHRQNMRARQNSTPKGNIPSLTIIVTVIKMFVNWIEKTKTTKHTPTTVLTTTIFLQPSIHLQSAIKRFQSCIYAQTYMALKRTFFTTTYIAR